MNSKRIYKKKTKLNGLQLFLSHEKFKLIYFKTISAKQCLWQKNIQILNKFLNNKSIILITYLF